MLLALVSAGRALPLRESRDGGRHAGREGVSPIWSACRRSAC
ncbi:uncharacterized protein BCN122_II1474 [Burkholderia cenocepacia]|nr:uncharacterized protein BCN122_II1474 [Burkholderia cenocepacia]